MRVLPALVVITLVASPALAERLWVNNIAVSEYGITWNYTETFTGMDSIAYRVDIDRELGNNDSFVSSWELLKADREMRKKFQESIEKEPDIRINDMAEGIEVTGVESRLAPETIGKAHAIDAIVNTYNVSYRLKNGIYNASSIWFLGQANTSVSIVMPAGIEVANISGMNNATKNITDHIELGGFFKGITAERGEITLNFTGKAPLVQENATQPIEQVNATKPAAVNLPKIRDASVIGLAILIIALIYVFKLRR